MANILIGNLCSVLAMIADCLGSSRKKAKEVLWLQTLGQLIYCIGAIILKGYSAAVQNAVSIARNIAATRKSNPKALEWLLVALAVGLGIVFNNRGIWGWLPIIANLEYSIAVFRFKDNERALKIAFAVCIVLFAGFNVILLNFVGLASNLVVFVTTVSCVIKGDKEIKEAVKRIKKMEQNFDALLSDRNCENGEAMLKELSEYSDSGLWLHDYELDERGKLPKNLKRGVLSQDGLYNMLSGN